MSGAADRALAPPDQIRLEEALKAIGRGWALTPLRGKVPLLRNWQATPPATLEQVQRWIARGYNLGLRTGLVSGVSAIDDDTADGSGVAKLNLPRTVTVVTGSGKRHGYFRCPPHGLHNSVSRLADHVDVRGDGGQVVFVGSIHPETGLPYRWADGLSPDEVELAELPDHVLKLLQQKPPPLSLTSRVNANGTSARAATALREEIHSVRQAPAGQRHDMLLCAASKLGSLAARGELEVEEARAELLEAARENQPDQTREAERAIEDGLRFGLEHPRGDTPRAQRSALGLPDSAPGDQAHSEQLSAEAPLGQPPPPPINGAAGTGIPACTWRIPRTDIGNAERLVARHRDDLLYCGPRGGWFVWDGLRYRRDDTGKVELMCKGVVRSILGEAAAIEDPDERKAHIKHAFASESDARIRAMVARARVEKPFACRSDDLDADDWLLCVENGTLDLRTGDLRPHRREHKITKLAPVRYDLNARCEDWERFVRQATGGDEELEHWLLRLMGYALTGETSEDRVPILHGPGGTGKTTFLEAIKATLGDYARTVSWEALLRKTHGGGGGPRDEIARLAGARLVIASEVEPGREFNVGLLKSLSGDDTIAARLLYKGTFEFRPTFKLILAANHLPALDPNDTASWRRVVVVPFLQRPAVEDKKLRARLRKPDARAAILASLMRGLADWREHGLGTTVAIERFTEQYRKRDCLFDRFLAECCEVHPDASSPSRELYNRYAVFVERATNDREPIGEVRFGREMSARGFPSIDGSWGGVKGKGRLGIRLRAPEPPGGGSSTGSTSSTGSPASCSRAGVCEQSLGQPVEPGEVVESPGSSLSAGSDHLTGKEPPAEVSSCNEEVEWKG